MEDNKLYQKLGKLTKADFKDFIAFAESPFFNTDKQIPRLLRQLQAAYPNFPDSPALAKNKMAKALGIRSEESLRQLRSRTLRLLPDFLAQQELKKQPNTKRLLLLDALQRHEMDQELRGELDNFEVQIDPDDRPFHARFRLDDFRLRELLRRQESLFVFEQYIDSGNRYFLLKKIKQGCELLLFQQVYKKQAPDTLFTELDFLLPLHDDLIRNNPVLHAWRLLYGLLNNPADIAGLADLQDFIADSRANLPKKERKDLFNTANNLLIGKLTKGHFNTLPELNWFYQTLYGQYRFAADEDLLPEQGFIQPGRFKNAMAAACICGQTAWARTFVEENLQRVAPGLREELNDLCQASIAFYENDFKTAGERLARLSTRGNEFYFFDAESIQMRIYFLENDYEPFEARGEAVRKKLKKSGLSQAHLDNYGNYFRLLREIFQLKLHPGTTAAQWAAFRQKVEETNPVNQKKWLLEQINR